MRQCMTHGEGMTRLPLVFVLMLSSLGCARSTSRAEAPSPLGVTASASAMEAVLDTKGPVTVQSVASADWEVPLAGLLNLDAPAAKKAHLVDRPEPIQVAFHVLRHPTRGTFLVDTGVERDLFEAPDRAAIRGVVSRFMNLEKLSRRVDTRSFLDHASGPVAGVFLTHLHLDHVSGMRDVPAGVPVFVGPGETRERTFTNVFVKPSVDRALEGKGALTAWQFEPDPDGVFEGVVDVFGDATTWALYVPGHTAGSTAFVVRTPEGPVLLTGDACHTTWGWDHAVEPGTFSDDQPRSRTNLLRLKALAARHPSLDVRLGHQSVEGHRASASARR